MLFAILHSWVEQDGLFGAEASLPAGLSYRSELLGRQGEAALIGRIAQLPFAPFQFHAFEGKRRTVSFGWKYRFDGSGLAEAEPMPSWLLAVREKAAAFAGLSADALVHALIIGYQEGASIGWHRDRPDFGEVIGSDGSRVPHRRTGAAPSRGVSRGLSPGTPQPLQFTQ
ncbi:MAG: alpha-ketoglutarate-dependent dioxygenase AlkB [Pseudomonadota bacterium]|nr:alpha-ketoglutarate-dependent dioxygenase AlkB [Pseudomonadota bacterium]